ncbi:MAG: class C sortase, partial [Oscillospiraceae bacterium]|nr:class C sortase [Oscillospiraceae bacterium]
MKSRISTFLIVIILLTGIGLMLYPFVSDRVITFLNERAIERNGEALRAMEALEKSRLLKRAREYNENLNGGIRDAFSGDSAEDDAYMSLLNPSGDGMMGAIAIPKIGVE